MHWLRGTVGGRLWVDAYPRVALAVDARAGFERWGINGGFLGSTGDADTHFVAVLAAGPRVRVSSGDLYIGLDVQLAYSAYGTYDLEGGVADPLGVSVELGIVVGSSRL